MKTLVIVNPAAARGALQKSWDSLAKGLQGKIHHFDVGTTCGPGDATRLVREAIQGGYEMIVSVGGDGTLRECVNGFFLNGVSINKKAILGILPFGRGSDLARALGISRVPEQAIEHLAGKKTRTLDVGRASLRDKGGNLKTQYFLNNAYMGLGTHVDYYSNRSPKIFGTTGAYFYGVLRGFLEYKHIRLLCTGSKGIKDYTVTNLVIANGPYFGSGMKAAPRAKLDDGLLDIISIGKMALHRSLIQLRRLYSGDYLDMKEVDFFRDHLIKVRSAQKDLSVSVQMDGDEVGCLPATFEILPGAIRVKI